ncbi:hypothetical protein QFC20_006192 [Naganishia adeliensis]|uniref:Uncharacterized protein n=1 Tax=Naganishia adeliensis TaxID=92952 RepID=A0ACC2VFT8_9TREE|nr:hypothetical protein QFC20_006192 [Naganishia adeliensis]
MPSEAQVTKSAIDRLKSAIQAKRKADKALGFENYLKVNPNTKKRVEVQDADRLFSMSSGSYQASMNLNQSDAEERARFKQESSNLDEKDSSSKKRKREESIMSGMGEDSQVQSRPNGHGGRRVKGQSARAEDD